MFTPDEFEEEKAKRSSIEAAEAYVDAELRNGNTMINVEHALYIGVETFKALIPKYNAVGWDVIFWESHDRNAPVKGTFLSFKK